MEGTASQTDGDHWLSAGVLIALAVVEGTWEEYGPAIKKGAADVLIVTLLLLGALPWWSWLIVLGAIVWAKWAWYHRRIRQRQEVIIELLLEIRDSTRR